MAHRLVLHPVDPFFRPDDPAVLIAALEGIGLIGERWGEDGELRYRIGDHFLQLVTFMGCAPAVSLEPPAEGGADFCHVRLCRLAAPHLLADPVRFNPRCPHCGRRSPDWRKALATWASDPRQPVRCPLCDTPARAEALDFRHTAALASTFVEIHDVHPGEALPTEALFNALRAATGIDWMHAWVA